MSIERRRPAVTLEQVAAKAGVSRATVSRVVNEQASVDPDLASRVQVAAAELGYVPNLSARSLASSRSGSIALVVPYDVERFFRDPFFGTVIAGLHTRLRRSDFLLTMAIETEDTRRTAEYLLGSAVDAVVLFSSRRADELVARLSTSIPVVLGGRPADPTITSCHYVDFDNVEASRRATLHLLSRTSSPVATIAGPRDTPTGIDRLAGFLAAHRDLARVPGPVVDGDFSFESGVEGAREIMRRAPLLGAVFAANDLMALGALEELAHQGRRVPDDVAVMGFDDAHGLDTVDPILSTVRQDSREQGTVMGDLVLSLLAGDEPPRSTVIPTSLVLRKTA